MGCNNSIQTVDASTQKPRGKFGTGLTSGFGKSTGKGKKLGKVVPTDELSLHAVLPGAVDASPGGPDPDFKLKPSVGTWLAHIRCNRSRCAAQWDKMPDDAWDRLYGLFPPPKKP